MNTQFRCAAVALILVGAATSAFAASSRDEDFPTGSIQRGPAVYEANNPAATPGVLHYEAGAAPGETRAEQNMYRHTEIQDH